MVLMNEKIQFSLDCLRKVGFQNAQCHLHCSEKTELCLDNYKISLLRTIFNTQLELLGIHENRKATITINNLDDATIKDAASDVMEMAKASEPDPANAISDFQPTQQFRKGPLKGDTEVIYDRLKSFVEYSRERYPITNLEEGSIEHNLDRHFFLNSNGTQYASNIGWYNFWFLCTSKDGHETSSFDYTSMLLNDLDSEMKDCGATEMILRNSANSIKTGSYPGKGIGEVLITPQSFNNFYDFLIDSISDYLMIAGDSVYKDKIDERIAASDLTIHSKPTDSSMNGGYFFTHDGFAAEDINIVEKGILKTHLLSLLGSNKTGKAFSRNRAGSIVIEAGEFALDEMIKGVEKGIVLGRFSGGRPSVNGDFSGVAKNSFYVENGEIKQALSETMISGNVVELLKDIRQISKERINFGDKIIPWVLADGVTISGSGRKI